jgi:hypothetical protein
MIKIDQSIIINLLIISACIIVIFFFYLISKHKRNVVRDWVTNENVELILFKKISIFHPFPVFTTSPSQAIFKALVKDKTGKKKIAWLRIGNFWFGAFSSKVECIWSDYEINKY